jgi:hypothetical protein
VATAEGSLSHLLNDVHALTVQDSYSTVLAEIATTSGVFIVDVICCQS